MNAQSNPNNPNGLKLIVAGDIAGKDIHVDYKTEPKQTCLGRLPVLKLDSTDDEFFSISAAVQFIAPVSEQNTITANKWLEWDATQLQPAIVSYGGSGKLDVSHKPRVWSLLKQLNTALKDKQYLINDKSEVNVVDASLWVTLWSTVAVTDAEVISKEFANIDQWLKRIQGLPTIQKSLKKVKLERGIPAVVAMSASSWFPLNSYTGPGKSSGASASETSPSEDKEVKVVTQEELDSVKQNWSSKYSSIKEASRIVLPKKGERNVLVTSALPYVNNVPHLGNIIGCVLSADIFARYCRQRNYNTLYVSGTDEYGTATEAKAIEENLTPQQICDKYFDIHNEIYRWFGIGFDHFGRTSTPEQTELVQDMFLRVKDQGYITSCSVDQLLCQKCDRFLADRFVEGTCPGCKYEDARGDQCDGCGHLVNATELIKPRCKVCGTAPIIKASTQFFLDLPKVEERLKQWGSAAMTGWSAPARSVMKPWLRDGLKPRCITRDLKWGIPVPLDGYRNKVFYVWFDAPIGYISITKKYTKDFEKWWKPEDVDVELFQFMAKDNVPFHGIMFPATLLAADRKHVLVKHLMATEYLNYEDTKFSKSRGIGVFGTDAKETGIPADVWRFYLAYIRPETMDSNFNWVDLATKNNSELLNNLGNFVNRALSFIEKNYNSKVPAMELLEDDLHVLALVQRELTSYVACLEQAKLRDGLKHVMAISKHGNQYMQYQAPWFKIKGSEEDKKKGATVIGVSCNIACLLSALLAPYMPSTARELRSQLGLPKQDYGYIPEVFSIMLPAGHTIGKPTPLFSKIEEKVVEELRKKYAGRQESTPPRESTQAPMDVASLEAAVAKQGLLVRDLKAKGDKSVWQPQVQILLDLKKKLAEAQSKGAQPASQAVPLMDVASLEAAVAKQGLLVRDLKAKSDKSVWQPQVQILLDLKKKLAEAQSNSAQTASQTVPPAQQNGNVADDVATLEAEIAKQGTVVRELKAKGDKSVWQPQVDILLKLKQKLSALTGAPASAPADKKSKKKK